MTTINLKLGYFIETKKLSYNLKKKYIGKDKSGNPKEAVKTVGYFGSMEQAIDCYLKEVVSDTLDGEEMELKEYADRVDQAVSLAVHGLDKVLSEVRL